MKSLIVKLLDRIHSHHHDRLPIRNEGYEVVTATTKQDRSPHTTQDEVSETKPIAKSSSIRSSIPTNTLAKAVQGTPLVLLASEPATSQASIQQSGATSYIISPDPEGSHPSLLAVIPKKPEAVQNVVLFKSDSLQGREAENIKPLPHSKCQLVRTGAIRRHVGINTQIKSSHGHSAPMLPPFPVTFGTPRSARNKDDETTYELDRCSCYPLCSVCQTIIRRYTGREWYATVLSTQESLRKRALEGCPLCMLYHELMTPYSNRSTIIASPTTPVRRPWPSDGKGILDISSAAADEETAELIYKRETGSKLALHYLKKKYTIVFDWQYTLLTSGPESVRPLTQLVLYPDILELLKEYTPVSGKGWMLIQSWLLQCAGHQSCQAYRTNFLPTRLIHVGRGTPPAIHLVRGSQLERSTRYMTLSHCWGSRNFEMLLKSNEDAFEKIMPFETLPKTFQESIVVAQRLAISYLWIDSLCIIQDSLEDWRYESALMANVYSNSYCNISATAAADGADGLFFNRQTNDLQVLQLTMQKNRSEYPRLCLAHDAEFFTKSIDRAPLNQRGWVVQERLLSRCNLHFGAKQILWECCELNACEMMPEGLISGISRPLMKDAVSTMRGLKHLRIHGDRIDLWAFSKWADIIHAYTEALLSQKTDRLVAISGLASIFQDFYALHYPTRPEYVAGLWADRAHLAAQLLWHAKQIRTTTDLSPTFIAPTWSWASVDGPIGDVFNFSQASVDIIALHFPCATTTLVDENDLFGQVSSGVLSLKGKLARASYTALPVMINENIRMPLHGILKIEEYRPAQDFSWYTRDMQSSNPMHTNVWWDRLLCPGSTVANGRVFLLPIRGEPSRDESNMESLEGLILESTNPRAVVTSKGSSFVPLEFRRVGKWTAYDRGSVDRVRAGCQYFDVRAPREEGDTDSRAMHYGGLRGKTYNIHII